MRPLLACLAMAAPVLMAPSGLAKNRTAAATHSLCAPRERTIFSCSTGPRNVAVCVGADGSAQYRAGQVGKYELASPPRSAGLSYANTPYSGGGESQVRFVNGAYAYTVYSGVYRTSFGADGHHDPAFASGVIVSKGDTIVSQKKCTSPGDAVLDLSLAEKYLPEGTFQDHD